MTSTNSAGGGIELHVVVGNGLHQLVGAFACNAFQGVAFELDLLHLVDKHHGGAGEHGAVVEKTAHVAEKTDAGCLQLGQPPVVVAREVDDAVDAALLHHTPGLGHRATMILDVDLGSSVELVDEAFAGAALALVDDGDGKVANHLILVDSSKDEGVEEGGDEEDEDDPAVVQDAVNLDEISLPNVGNDAFQGE